VVNVFSRVGSSPIKKHPRVVRLSSERDRHLIRIKRLRNEPNETSKPSQAGRAEERFIPRPKRCADQDSKVFSRHGCKWSHEFDDKSSRERNRRGPPTTRAAPLTHRFLQEDVGDRDLHCRGAPLQSSTAGFVRLTSSTQPSLLRHQSRWTGSPMPWKTSGATLTPESNQKN